MSEEAINNLAVKIARLLQTESPKSDLNSLQKSIEKINERLENIETSINNQNLSSTHSSSFTINSPKHPSLEKFDVDEIIADRNFENTGEEKPCPYEPTGKPCDHCSMCNSLGF
jgi:hypothetical protein